MVITAVIIAIIVFGYALMRWGKRTDEGDAPAASSKVVTPQGGGGPLNPEK